MLHQDAHETPGKLWPVSVRRGGWGRTVQVRGESAPDHRQVESTGEVAGLQPGTHGGRPSHKLPPIQRVNPTTTPQHREGRKRTTALRHAQGVSTPDCWTWQYPLNRNTAKGLTQIPWPGQAPSIKGGLVLDSTGRREQLRSVSNAAAPDDAPWEFKLVIHDHLRLQHRCDGTGRRTLCGYFYSTGLELERL